MRTAPPWLILPLLGAALLSPLTAQDSGTQETRGDWQSKVWLSAQANVVAQFYPPFSAAYSGTASLNQNGGAKPTWVATVYTGYALTRRTEVFFDVESARGAGVSGALGLGGLENLDATDSQGSAAPYVARLMIRHVIPLGRKTTESDRNPLSLNTTTPEKRLELRFGKMSLTDFFDLNAVGSDSHLQFLNYAIDNNATYDFAANTRGYTYALLAELYQPGWAIRFAEAVQPSQSDTHRFDWDLGRSNSESLEIELHPSIRDKQPLTVRALSFLNHKQLGDYKSAVAAYQAGIDPVPTLSKHLSDGTGWGVGINGECALPATMRVFGRWGWTPGNRETFQFAEADRTLAFGGDLGGTRWKRSRDRLGIALAVNGLSEPHRAYLALGGQSYLLGDGALDYSREKILESYYNVPLFHGVFGAFDVQRVWNPGYNHARGPVIIFGLRLHLEGDVHFN